MENILVRVTRLIFPLLVLTVLCAGCVSTQSVVNRLGSRWIDKNFDEFVLRYGVPQKKFELNSGDFAYVWNSGTSSIDLPATATTNIYGNTAYTQMNSGGRINMFCEVQIVTTRNGIIKHITILKDTIGFWTTSKCHEVFD